MAPEQAAGRLDLIGPHTDVYGLGAILYEILTGDPPNDLEHLKGPGLGQELEPLPPSSRLWSQLPPELCRITRKALAPRREDRYANVAAFAGDLTQFLKGGGWFETLQYRAGESVVTEGEPGDTGRGDEAAGRSQSVRLRLVVDRGPHGAAADRGPAG